MNRLPTLSVAFAGIGVLAGSARTVAPEPRTFMFVEGRDTGSETFTRTANSLTGDMAFGKNLIHYEGKIAGDGTIPRLDIRVSHAGVAAEAVRRISVVVDRDSAQLTDQIGSKGESIRVPTEPGALPFINLSVGLSEPLVARGRLQKSKTARVPVVIAFNLDNLDKQTQQPLRTRATAEPVLITFVSADSVLLGTSNAKDRVRLAIGPGGDIRGVVSGADAKDHFKAIPKPAKPRS